MSSFWDKAGIEVGGWRGWDGRMCGCGLCGGVDVCGKSGEIVVC